MIHNNAKITVGCVVTTSKTNKGDYYYKINPYSKDRISVDLYKCSKFSVKAREITLEEATKWFENSTSVWYVFEEDNNNMNNVVNFENDKYVWEEINGKGKCLVPYKPHPFDNLKCGDILLNMEFENQIICVNNKFALAETREAYGKRKGSGHCYSPTFDSIAKLIDHLKSYCSHMTVKEA